MRVRIETGLCKPVARVGCLLGAWLLVGCVGSLTPKTVSLQALEQAPPAAAQPVAHAVVASADTLRGLCTPLGPRLGLIQIRSVAEWTRLARAAGLVQACPDLRRGMLVGLLCWAGTPVDGGAPIRIRSVHTKDGGGLLRAQFAGGSYLPDGTAYLDTEFVPDLNSVLAVDVNGTLFAP